MTAADAEARLTVARERYLAGELRAAVHLALEAAELAKGANRPDLLAQAALVDDGVPDPATSPITERIARDALLSLPEDAPVRAMLLGQLSMALHHRERFAESEAAANAALALADESNAPEAKVVALNAKLLALAGSDYGQHMRDLVDPMLAAAETIGSATGELFARNWRIAAAMRLADTATVTREIDSLDVLSARSGLPLVTWNAVFARAGLDHALGRFEEAEAAARLARDVLPASQRHHTQPLFIAQIMLIATDRGVEPPEINVARSIAVGAPVIQAVMTARYDLEMRDRVSAQASFDALRPRLGDVAMDRRGLAALVAAIELAVAFADREIAAALRDRLEPFAGGMVASAIGAVGPVAHFLARAETLLGRHDDAIAHADAAALLAARGGFRPWHARARLCLAEALAARGTAGDVPRARHLATLAEAAAGHLSMRGLHEQARDLVARLDPSTRLSPREREIARLIAGGASNRGIADALGLSERTIESHVQHILTKLDLHARTQIAAWVVESGLAPTDG